jgi:hypothetical protein
MKVELVVRAASEMYEATFPVVGSTVRAATIKDAVTIIVAALQSHAPTLVGTKIDDWVVEDVGGGRFLLEAPERLLVPAILLYCAEMYEKSTQEITNAMGASSRSVWQQCTKPGANPSMEQFQRAYRAVTGKSLVITGEGK